MLFTVNVLTNTILNRFETELPFISLSNCISLNESRGNISLVGTKCGVAHIPYLRPICAGCATKNVRMVAPRWVKRRLRVRLLLKIGVGRLQTGVVFVMQHLSYLKVLNY